MPSSDGLGFPGGVVPARIFLQKNFDFSYLGIDDVSIQCKIEDTTGDNGNNKTGNETMLNQTIAADKIIKNCERSLKASCVSCPDTMMECILDTAQEYVNDGGYRWDVALAKACKIYPATRYAAEYIYGPLS